MRRQEGWPCKYILNSKHLFLQTSSSHPIISRGVQQLGWPASTSYKQILSRGICELGWAEAWLEKPERMQ